MYKKKLIIKKINIVFNFILIIAALVLSSPSYSAETPRIPAHLIGLSPNAPRWETKSKSFESLQSRKSWTIFTRDFLKNNATSLLNGPKDVTTFCKHYFTLTELEHKLDFWTYFISAVVQLESDFNMTTSYHESSLGDDELTKRPVRSEGLMQVSYQDKHYPFCDQFNWEEDKNKEINDPTKTIFNPFLNLACGIGIINNLAQKTNHIILQNAYYDVLRYRSKRWGEDQLPVDKIIAWTQSLPMCKNPQPTQPPNPPLDGSPNNSIPITQPQQPNIIENNFNTFPIADENSDIILEDLFKHETII